MFEIDPVRGDVICTSCACCLPDRILDETLEKRNFADSGKNHERTMEIDKHLSFASAGTTIGNGQGSLQKAQNRLKAPSMSTQERNLNDGFHNIRHFETMFSLPRSVVHTAKDMMVEFEKKKAKTVQGARSEAFAVAVLYFAMNLHQVGKTIKEICALSSMDEKHVRSYIKKLQKAIPDKLAKHTTAEDFIPTIVSTLEAPVTLERLAGEIVRRAISHYCNAAKCGSEHVVGKRTSTIAAGAVLVAVDILGLKEVKAEDIAMCAQISVPTMQAMAKTIRGHWDAMFADEPGGTHGHVVKEILRAAAQAGIASQ